MELHCLPTETPTTASSCSTDPLYDNCPPFAQRERATEKEIETGLVCPFVTRPPDPGSPLPGLVPTLAEVQTVAGGGREPGSMPSRSYCSCRGGLGRQAWEAELNPGANKTREERECNWGIEDRAHPGQSPSPSQSEEHRSALSLYDNLPDAGTSGSLQDVFGGEMSLRQHLQEPVSQAGASEQIQGDVLGEDRKPWSSCETPYQKEPELDSGSFGFLQTGPVLHLPATSPHLYQAQCPVRWTPAKSEHPQRPLSPPRVPPPPPLADPSASALRSLLTSLQQQIVRQRDEYEAQIVSLEQRNEELQVEVVRLKSNLSQQRHWYQVVQAKTVECERARAAAELRNATLQREMEQFFDTFGELNNEAKKTEYIVKSF